MLFCVTAPGLYAQNYGAMYHSAPASSYMPDVLQIRLTPAALQLLPNQNIPSQGNDLKAIPELAALWNQFSFISYKSVVTIPLRSEKGGLHPSENKVLRWVKIQLANPKALLPALDALQGLREWVEVAEPVYRVELYDDEKLPFFEAQWFPNDTMFARQWHYHNTGQTGGTPDADIDLPEAWAIERGHPEVVVAVMDNGVDTMHGDLRANLAAKRGYNFYNGQPQLVAGNHGNHTSGTIGAVNQNVSWVSGIAGGDGLPNSGIRLLSCQIFGVPAGSGGIEDAFVWSAQNGSAISSNSWGYVQPGMYNQSVLDAIDFFIDNGGGSVLRNGLVIFSGGNGGDYAQRWPGVYSRVIGVTATNHNDKKAWYSTYHENLDIAAPGGELNSFSGGPLVNGGRGGILSTIVQSAGATGYMQGTSMAAPQVSGVAALVVSHGRGRLSADDVKSILLTQVDPINNLQDAFFQNRMGTGRLNAYKSVAKVQAMMSAPALMPPAQVRAQKVCNTILLNWQKNPATQNVLVAVSTNHARGGLFGIPSGNYAAGDSLPGGGLVIYRGGASSFQFSQPKEGVNYYFKVWSADAAGNYSMGIVTYPPIEGTSVIDTFMAKVNCYNTTALSWIPLEGCVSPKVLIAFNTTNNFGNPSGNYVPGAKLGASTVLYRGNAAEFLHTLSVQKDSVSLWYKLWPVFEDGSYGLPHTVEAFTPAALTSAYPLDIDTATIIVGWQRDSCFTGDVLVAYNFSGNFTPPVGDLKPGDVLPGGNGTVLYRGPSESVLHTGLTTNTLYNYSVWPVLDKGYGYPQVFSAKTLCFSTAYALPFIDSISPSSLLDCSLDTTAFRNFTAGPWPELEVVEKGMNPGIAPFAGRYMLQFNSYDTRQTNEVWMTSPKLSSKDIASVDVSFKWYEDGSDYTGEFFQQEGITLEWSLDKINWNSVITYSRIPEFGGNKWKNKQVTLPRDAGNREALFIRWKFRSAWGYNCYLDEIKVFATTPKVPDGNYTRAVAQFDFSDGFTNYYDSLGSLLLSLSYPNENLGHVDEELVVGAGGNTGAQLMATNNNYIRNPGGWATTGKYWQIENWTAPPTNIQIRQYVQQADLNALQQLAFTQFTPPATTNDTLRVNAWQARGANSGNASPATGHSGVRIAADYAQEGFWQFDYHSVETDSIQYTSGNYLPGVVWIQNTIQQAGSGGVGMGSPKGNGALAPHWLSITGRRDNKTTLLDWTTGYERLWLQMQVERALQGSSTFTSLGVVFPGGYSQTGATYNFSDNNLLANGNYQYRIVATDAKGQKFISPLANISVNDTRGILVFPNPVANGRFTVFAETEMNWLRLSDALGRILYTSKPGATQSQVLVPHLPAGVYYLQVGMEAGTKTQKILIAR